MANLLHIAEGWSKSLGLLEVSKENRELSNRRMAICATCPAAKESSFLKMLRGKMHDVEAIYCTECGCPCNEKTLVNEEKCPLGYW